MTRCVYFHQVPLREWTEAKDWDGTLPLELTFDLFRTTKGRITQ